MIAFIDLRATREHSVDRAELRAYLQQLVGQPFLFLRFSYGDELTLHFGQAERYRSPKLSNVQRGSYVVSARASSWFLSSHTSPCLIIGTSETLSFSSQTAQPLAPQDLEARKVIRPGSVVVGVDAVEVSASGHAAYAFGLSLSLQDSTSVFILPSPVATSPDDASAIADWEILTPYNRYLTVGPSLHWSYLPSDAGV